MVQINILKSRGIKKREKEKSFQNGDFSLLAYCLTEFIIITTTPSTPAIKPTAAKRVLP